MNEKATNKKQRARSKRAKDEKFQKILQTAAELYFKNGKKGFNLRTLAGMLGMSNSNLYRYVESKRELWIEIRRIYFKELQETLQDVINNHQGTYIDLVTNLIEKFIEFSTKDYRKFRFMHLMSPPTSDKLGKIEKTYKRFNILKSMSIIIKKAIDAGEINETNPEELTYFLFEIAFGHALIEHFIASEPSNVREPIDITDSRIDLKKFREYFMKQVKRLITILTL
jgi:AcrR family transcriptional regulator